MTHVELFIFSFYNKKISLKYHYFSIWFLHWTMLNSQNMIKQTKWYLIYQNIEWISFNQRCLMLIFFKKQFKSSSHLILIWCKNLNMLLLWRKFEMKFSKIILIRYILYIFDWCEDHAIKFTNIQMHTNIFKIDCTL